VEQNNNINNINYIYNINIILNNWELSGKMVKKVFSVTIDEKVLKQWKNYTEEECINSSKLLEKILENHLLKRKAKK
jgi:hypothetical protein